MSTYTLNSPSTPLATSKSTSLLFTPTDPTVERLKNLYKAPHQAEFLYLQAEVDSLLRRLETTRNPSSDSN